MGKLKEAVMTIQDEVFEETGREITFEEAGEILMGRIKEPKEPESEDL